MRSFLDSNVLVAAFLETHAHYQPSFRLFSALKRGSAFCSAHNLAEAYSTFTRYPNKDRLTPDQALVVLEQIQDRITVIALTPTEYWSAVRRFAGLGVVGGGIYDGLIAACAMKADADILYTWNTSHFMRLGDDIARRVRTPN